MSARSPSPVASVVIPTYNQRQWSLDAAVDSVRTQTVPVELIVVDDGSDPPASGATIRHERNRGIAAALNTGIAAMATEWFCWLSSDDLFSPAKVEVQLNALLASGRRASFHRYYLWSNPLPTLSEEPLASAWLDMSSHKRQRQQLGTGCAINGSTVMIHRSVFDDVGLFDESYKYGQDWEMWCRIATVCEWLPINEFLGYRFAGGNLTERIAADAEMRAVRDAEDGRIKSTYRR